MPVADRKKAKLKDEAERYRRGVTERIYAAFEDYNSGLPRSGKLGQADFGRLVAELRKLPPIPQVTVSRWMSETNPALPDLLTLRAIATVLNVNVLWLLYGDDNDGDDND